MSAVTWANTVRCDYPDCQSVAEVQMEAGSLRRTLPPGWLDMPAAMVSLRDAFGSELREFCSIHSVYPLDRIVAALKFEKRTDGDSG